MTTERHYDALVIGAGVTGLAAARQFARAGLRACVLEAEARVGGAVHSAHITIDHKDYWLELGAHTLFNSYHTLLTLFPELHLEQTLLHRRRLPFRLWYNAQMRSIPGALHWGELLRSAPNALRHRRTGKRAGDWFRTVTGRHNYDEVIGPSLDALLCQPAAEFPAELVFKPRPRARTYPRSFTLQGGLGAMVHDLAHGFELRTSTPVLRLARRGHRMACETAIGDFLAPRLLLAVPADEAARLLAPIAPGVVPAIPVAELDSTAVVLHADRSPVPPVTGMVARGAPWYSMVSRDVVPDERLRGFTFHFRPGFPADDRVEMAAGALGVKPDSFLATRHAHHRLPGLRIGHAARIASLDRGLAGLPVGVAGNWFGGLSIEDCVARAHHEAERLLRTIRERA